MAKYGLCAGQTKRRGGAGKNAKPNYNTARAFTFPEKWITFVCGLSIFTAYLACIVFGLAVSVEALFCRAFLPAGRQVGYFSATVKVTKEEK